MLRKTTIDRYAGLVIAGIGVFAASLFAAPLFHLIEHNAEAHLLLPLSVACVLFILGGVAHYATLRNPVPSFVAAIFLGMLARPLVAPVVEHPHVLMALVSAAVAYVLFSGGLETKWEDFRKLFWKIASLSFIGLFVTALLFSLLVYGLGQALGVGLSLTTAVLLGAVLASTDPAALIPVLKNLSFKKEKRGLQDLGVAESALTDVTGTLLTFAFLLLIERQVPFESVFATYGQIFGAGTAAFLALQLLWGVIAGVAGYLLLDALHARKCVEHRDDSFVRRMFSRLHRMGVRHGEYDADAAFFFAVPLLAFVAALLLGGSGYLAAFVVGLLLGTLTQMHHTEAYFMRTIEAFLKPMIFVLLGAMVDVQALIAYAPIGIIAALAFMFVIRPIAVFLSLGFWLRTKGASRMEMRDLLFMSIVRETGAIPAALLITLYGKGVGDAALVSVGMWIILGTLIVLPLMTPAVTRRLKLVEA